MEKKKLTKQQIFDKVCIHASKQKQRAITNNACHYRLETGNKKKVLKCFIGIFISKKDYTNDMEGTSLFGSPLRKIINNVFGPDIDNDDGDDFLEQLQKTHDYSYNADMLKYKLNLIAKDYNLDNSKVELITKWK